MYSAPGRAKELPLTSPITARPYDAPRVLIDDLPPYEAPLETLPNTTRHLPLVVTVAIDTMFVYATRDGLFVSALKKSFNFWIGIVLSRQQATSFPRPVELRELSDGASALTHASHRGRL